MPAPLTRPGFLRLVRSWTSRRSARGWMRRPSDGPGARYVVVLGTAVLWYVSLGTVLGILPGCVHRRGGDAVLLGFAGGAPAVTGAAGRPLGGRLADHHGPARV